MPFHRFPSRSYGLNDGDGKRRTRGRPTFKLARRQRTKRPRVRRVRLSAGPASS